MPDDGSKLCNVAVLADASRSVELVVPVAGLLRVAPLLTPSGSLVSAIVAFRRDQGRVVADIALQAQLQQQCQRCLTPMPVPVVSRSQVVLLAAESEADAVPPEFETALAPDGRMRLADLVEEELLLALPAAPRHAGSCPTAPLEAPPEGIAAPTQRPFAALSQLLAGRTKQ
jgi:uncharacterized protein